MPCLSVPRCQEPMLLCSYDPRREPCVLVVEQGNDLIERRTYYREHVPRPPPPSPKSNPLTRPESNEPCPSISCALLLVDRKIQAHQARLSPIQHRTLPSLYCPTLLSDSVSGMKLECSDEQMLKTTLLRQVLSASDDDEMTATNSSCHSSRSSGTNTLVNDLSSDREVDSHSAAISVHYQRRIAPSPQSAIQPSSPKSLTLSLFNLRSSRDAIAGAPSRLRSPSPSNNASGPGPTITSRQISSPTPIGSSAIPEIAALPLEYKQSKAKSWPGPCSQLPGPDTVSMPKATTRSKSRKCDFACVCCKERKGRCDGGMPSYGKCLPHSEICSLNSYSVRLQPLEEHARGDEAMDENQAATMEEERSRFSDYSTDEDDDSQKVPSNVRLVNPLGRLSQMSKPRLSWANLFSKS